MTSPTGKRLSCHRLESETKRWLTEGHTPSLYIYIYIYTTVRVSVNVQVGPGLQCRLTSPRRLYTKLHLSRELELKTRESCLLGISARNEGQNSPSADKNQKFGKHSITFAPHRPQQKENQTNIGGSIEKCGALFVGIRGRRTDVDSKGKKRDHVVHMPGPRSHLHRMRRTHLHSKTIDCSFSNSMTAYMRQDTYIPKSARGTSSNFEAE